jgi:hypothetical protein
MFFKEFFEALHTVYELYHQFRPYLQFHALGLVKNLDYNPECAKFYEHMAHLAPYLIRRVVS